MKTVAAVASRLRLEAWFARINWNAHLLPTVRGAVKEFSQESKVSGLGEVYLSVLSEDFSRGHYSNQKEEIWGDSITIGFGSRAVPVRAVVKVANRQRVLAETRAALVISQTVSGGVVAFIYPPTSDVQASENRYYAVKYWQNPATARIPHILHLLKLTTQTDQYCGNEVYPNRRGARVMAKLQAKDSVIASGGSKIWMWLTYVYKATRATLRIYGIGSPTPQIPKA
jgi:hypothetical protein